MKRFKLTVANMTLMLVVSSSALAGNIGALSAQKDQPSNKGNIGATLNGNIGALLGNIGAALFGNIGAVR